MSALENKSAWRRYEMTGKIRIGLAHFADERSSATCELCSFGCKHRIRTFWLLRIRPNKQWDGQLCASPISRNNHGGRSCLLLTSASSGIMCTEKTVQLFGIPNTPEFYRKNNAAARELPGFLYHTRHLTSSSKLPSA